MNTVVYTILSDVRLDLLSERSCKNTGLSLEPLAKPGLFKEATPQVEVRP